MGGAAAGEVASGLFKKTVIDLFSTCRKRSFIEVQKLVLECFETANAGIMAHVEEEPSHSGMGCTAELLTFNNNDFILGHVGDSRTYRLRRGNLQQLTKDHTLVQTQEDRGMITREQAKKHSLRNVILRVVGVKKQLEVDFIHGSVLPGDIFLLCSDGLTTMVEDEKIKEIMAFNGPPVLKTTMLIDQANYAGGKDNVTVVLVEIK